MSTASTAEILLKIKSDLEGLKKAREETTAFRKQLLDFKTVLKAGFTFNFGTAAANALLSIGPAIKGLARDAVGLGGTIKDLSEQTGASAEAVQVLQLTAERAGTTFESVRAAASHLNIALANSRTIGSSASDAFKRLGLDAAALEKLPLERRLQAVATALVSAKDRTEAYRAVAELLGARNTPILMAALRDLAENGYDKLAESAKAAGLVMSDDTIKRLDAAQKEIEKFKRALTIATGEAIGDGTRMVDVLNKDFSGTMGAYFRNVFHNFMQGGSDWNELNAHVKKVLDTGKAAMEAQPTGPETDVASVQKLIDAEAKLADVREERLKVDRDLAQIESVIGSVKKNEFLTTDQRDAKLATYYAQQADAIQRKADALQAERKALLEVTQLQSRGFRSTGDNSPENVASRDITKLVKGQAITPAQAKALAEKRVNDRALAKIGDAEFENAGAMAEGNTFGRQQSFYGQLSAQFVQMQDSFKTLAQSITEVMGGAVSSLSSSFDGIFQRTMTVGEATQNFFKGVGQSITKALADMLSQWVIKHTLMAAVSRIFHTQQVAMHVGAEEAKTAATLKGAAIRLGTWIKEALAAVYAGAVQAFKAMASIPYVGPILGAAAMAAAVVGGMKMVKQIKLADGGVFTGSGRVRGPGHSKEDAINARLSDGEVVINEKSARSIGYERLLWANEHGELPAFGGGGIFSKIGAAVGKASGWSTWGQFLGSGGLNKKFTGPGFDKFQTQWNLMDGTKLYGGGATGAESRTPTSDQLAAAQLERAGASSANLDYIASLANRGTAESIAGSSGAGGGSVASGDGMAVNLNVYNFTDENAMMRKFRRDPETRKYIINTAQEAVT